MRRACLAAVLALAALGTAVASADDPLPPPRAVNPTGGPPATGPGGRPPASARVVEGRSLSTVSAEYRLAPGDEVEIEAFLPPEAEAANPLKDAKRFVVTPGGVVPVPKLRTVRLDGRTVGDVEREVQQRLKDAGVAAQAEVFVRVVEYAPRYVYLVGAAFARLAVTPFGTTNLLHVFAQAGEAMKDVNRDRVRVLSADGRTRLVDVRAVLAAGGTAPEAMLEPGDTVILAAKEPEPKPIDPTVYILGYVRTPAAYHQLDAQTRAPLTLLQLLAHAGGVSEYGNLKNVSIRKPGGTGPSARIPVNALAILRGQAADVPLEAGDIVYVDD